MGSVDKCDQFLSCYLIDPNYVIGIKWWKRILHHLLELSIANAMVIYFDKNPE